MKKSTGLYNKRTTKAHTTAYGTLPAGSWVYWIDAEQNAMFFVDEKQNMTVRWDAKQDDGYDLPFLLMEKVTFFD